MAPEHRETPGAEDVINDKQTLDRLLAKVESADRKSNQANTKYVVTFKDGEWSIRQFRKHKGITLQEFIDQRK